MESDVQREPHTHEAAWWDLPNRHAWFSQGSRWGQKTGRLRSVCYGVHRWWVLVQLVYNRILWLYRSTLVELYKQFSSANLPQEFGIAWPFKWSENHTYWGLKNNWGMESKNGFENCEGISCSSFSVKELDVIFHENYFPCITYFGHSAPPHHQRTWWLKWELGIVTRCYYSAVSLWNGHLPQYSPSHGRWSNTQDFVSTRVWIS